MPDELRQMFPLDDAPGPAVARSSAASGNLVENALRAAGAPVAATAGLDAALIGMTASGVVAGLVAVGLSAQVWIAPRVELTANSPQRAAAPIVLADDTVTVVETEADEAHEETEIEEPTQSTRVAMPSQPSSSPSRHSAEDRLAEANRLRAARAWRRAERMYRSVAAADPGSQAAYAALVAAGGLNLDHLRRPREALDLYRRAARRAGPLDDQVRRGVARSLERLGRRDAAAREWEELATTHPQSVLAEVARRRAEELRAEAD